MLNSLRNIQARVVCGLLLAVCSGASHAALGQIITNGTALMRSAVTLVVWSFMVGGLIALGMSGKMMWDKSKDRSDVTMGQIIWPAIGGAVMMALWFIGLNLIETMGGSASDIGRTG